MAVLEAYVRSRQTPVFGTAIGTIDTTIGGSRAASISSDRGSIVVRTLVVGAFECSCTDTNNSTIVNPTDTPVWPPGSALVTQNLVMFRGDTYIFDAQVLLRGNPVNLSGGTLTMTAKWAVTKDTAIFTRDSNGDGITVTDAANGNIRVTIEPENTEDLPASVCYLVYDIQLESGGNTYTVGYGQLKVVPDVTTP